MNQLSQVLRHAWQIIVPALIFLGGLTANLLSIGMENFVTENRSLLIVVTVIAGLLTVITSYTSYRASQQTTSVLEPAQQVRIATSVNDRYHRYLQKIARDFQYLSMMRAIDHRSASAESSGDAQMQLADVYIALNTTERNRYTVGLEGKSELRGQEDEPLSALTAFAQNSRMVLLGDPGSGKSTFVNHLALCLANEGLHPKADWHTRLPDWPAEWTNLIPIPMILREVAAWLETYRPPERKHALFTAYLTYWLAELGLEDVHDLLMQSVRDGTTLLLLDGLDEIPPDDDLLDPIKGMVESLHTTHKGPVLVTCRVLSYQDVRWHLQDRQWPTFELAKLTEEQSDQFITAWYRQLAANNQVRNADDLSTRLQRAVRRPDLRHLAGNPLLLTVMAIVHTKQGILPDARALLYDDIVDLLLWRWEAIKLEKPDGEETDWHLLLSEAVLSDIDVKKKLWELAFTVHGQSQLDNPDSANQRETTVATADISESDLLDTLRELHPDGSWDWAADMVEIMKRRAGLLVESRPKVYRFPHRTFQEHLAACHLSTQPNFAAEAMKLAASGAFWREVILLAVGRMVHTYSIEPPLFFVGELCPSEPNPLLASPRLGEAPKPDDLAATNWRNIWLAGECLLEIGIPRAQRHRTGKELVARVQQRLIDLVHTEQLTPRERAEAGKVLSALGDPRDLDEMVPIPAGAFTMGTKEADVEPWVAEIMAWYKRVVPNNSTTEDDIRRWLHWEVPQHQVTVDAFRISKYPVTNGQYAQFVQATDHQAPEHWRGNSPPDELRNHPVVYVSWHNAVAYCAWLSAERGEAYRLPTEAEWEKAARGTDGRAYPWGNAFDANRCNMYETGIGQISAVGLFTQAALPYGLVDMVGNVWEWTSTLWGEDWEKPLWPYPYHPDDGRENLNANDNVKRVLRGGSFGHNDNVVRCAYRYNYVPVFRCSWVGFRVVSPGC